LHSLTAVSNNAGIEDVGGLALITKSGQVSKLIISFLGNNKALEKQYLSGGIAIELCPQGTLAERIRAGGAGVPAFYTPTAVNTLLQDGKIPMQFDTDGKVAKYGTPREVREFNGRKYLMETALTGDVAIIRAWKADEAGNCVFRYVASGFNEARMAKAGTALTITGTQLNPSVPSWPKPPGSP
jgi:3-oxoacid CoA-transferase